MNRLALMQPYLFPYLGYYQLLADVNRFVFYDDAAFMKGSYINRNNYIVGQKPSFITIPVINKSSFKPINSLDFSSNVKKQLRTIQQNYSSAPFFDLVMPMVSEVFLSSDRNVARMCEHSIKVVASYLGIQTNIGRSSDIEYCRDDDALAKILAVCSHFDAKVFVNPEGGKRLYTSQMFAAHNMQLEFLVKREVKYSHGGLGTYDNLSIVDVLMWNSVDTVRRMLGEYDLESGEEI